MVPAIVVAAYNRPGSLSRLLGMLSRADYPDCDIPLVISIDGGGADEVKALADEFVWQLGPKRVVAHSKNLGLKRHILTCGDLTQEYGAVILLEDDLVVSPAFYAYASEVSEFYRDDENVAQVSLYAYEHGELCLERFYPLQKGDDVYFMQWASSWGQLWTDRQWSSFRVWYEKNSVWGNLRYEVPDYVAGWPDSSWKKFYIAYLSVTGRYAVYPYISYSSPYGDAGENVIAGSLPVVQSPLAWGHKGAMRLVDFDCSSVKYDAYFQPTKDLVDSLTDQFRQYEYVVDFQGVRPLTSVHAPYMLSVKSCANPIHAFGWNLYPFELNMTLSEGRDFFFGETGKFEDQLSRGKSMRLVYWSQRILGVPKTLYYSLVKILLRLGKVLRSGLLNVGHKLRWYFDAIKKDCS